MKVQIREVRIKMNMTQSKFTEITGMSLRYLQNIEAGDNIPTLDMLSQIAKKLNISIHELIDDSRLE